ncbi:MAG: hypothetical protein CSB46_04435 [Micrococcales bacterium]|nr:MAG: hypothetical protein CSB46_04435 [Micrococcales bacterium]
MVSADPQPSKLASTRRSRRGEVTNFDFSAPPLMSREHTRMLEIAFETFARQWATQLGSRLRCATDVALTAVDAEPYDSFAKNLISPTVFVLFSFDGMSAANSLLHISPQLALNHLDYALGGSGGKQEPRELTDIEVSITRGMVGRALESINYAFASIAPMTPRIDGFVQDPQLLAVAKAADMMLVAKFEVQLGDITETASLMTPLGPIAKALSDITGRDTRTAEEIRRASEATRMMTQGLSEVPVDAVVAMAPTISAPNAMLSLSVGDLVKLSHHTTTPLYVRAGETTVARAVVTTKGNVRACLIVNSEEDNP